MTFCHFYLAVDVEPIMITGKKKPYLIVFFKKKKNDFHPIHCFLATPLVLFKRLSSDHCLFNLVNSLAGMVVYMLHAPLSLRDVRCMDDKVGC